MAIFAGNQRKSSAKASGPPANSDNQRNRILALLRERGAAGVSNLELYRVCLRPPSRICELRKLGYEIRTDREAESRFRFTLIREPERPKTWAEQEREIRDQHAPLFVGVA